MRYTIEMRERKVAKNIVEVKATIEYAEEKQKDYSGTGNYYIELAKANKAKLERLKAFHEELKVATDFGGEIEIFNSVAFNKAIDEADIDECLLDGEFVKIHYIAKFPYEGKNIAWVMKYQEVMKKE